MQIPNHFELHNKMYCIVLLLVAIAPNFCVGQANAAYQIASELFDCYNETAYPGITVPETRLPITINTLIDLIRMVEDDNPNQDAVLISSQILQKFRQDGIRIGKPVSIGLPYSTNLPEMYNNMALLKYLIPNPKEPLNNQSLSVLKKCSLHYLISSATDARRRPNEDANSECSSLARYTQRIHKRQVELMSQTNRSSCPIELGVVSTKSGFVKAGIVLAGIASGFNTQTVSNCNNCDNRFAATVAGQLCETALRAEDLQTILIGADGRSNSSTSPKYYMMNKDTKQVFLSDAEIRGAIDGAVISKNIPAWKQIYPDLKVSQILDLYYSPRGAFDKSIRACNRSLIQTQYIPDETLKSETLKFLPLLNGISQTRTTIGEAVYPQLAESAVKTYNTYVAKMENIPCSDETIQRVAAEVIIFIDPTWDFKIIQPILANVLDNIDVNKFETTVKVLNGKNGDVIVKLTDHITDFHEFYNSSLKLETGFNYNKVFGIIESLTNANLNNATYRWGKSNIVILVPFTKPSDAENSYINHRRDLFFKKIESTVLLVLGPGSQEDYKNIVATPMKDVITLSNINEDTSLISIATTLVNRIKEVPRAIVNSKCTAKFNGPTGTTTLELLAEVGATTIYRIPPLYLFKGGSDRRLKVREESHGTITVSITTDLAETITSDQTIYLKSNETSIEVSKYCDGGSLSSCNPIYITVKGLQSDNKCTDSLRCRFPDNIKFTVTMEKLGCDSSVGAIRATFTTLIATFLLLIFKHLY